MKKYFGLILISIFLFSTMEIAIKCTGGTFNLIQLNFIRFLIGGLVLLPLSWFLDNGCIIKISYKI